MENFINCECKNWASDNRPPLTNHHRRCPEYNCEKESVELVKMLVKSIENDAADTDGLSDGMWEPYKRALVYLGEFGKLKKCLEKENYGQVPIELPKIPQPNMGLYEPETQGWRS